MLEMRAIPSEDSIRAALSKLVGAEQAPEESRASSSLWLDACFEQLSGNVLDVPWVLDVDVTVKPLYGKQEGAVLGYNPSKPGRPSHAYHSLGRPPAALPGRAGASGQ